MNTEQKAKAYDGAKARISKAYNDNRCTIGFMNEIFPELKKYENERIKKNCIHFLELQKQHHAATFEIEECIAWLKNFKPQNQRKPNENQIKEFNSRISTSSSFTRNYTPLYRLGMIREFALTLILLLMIVMK